MKKSTKTLLQGLFLLLLIVGTVWVIRDANQPKPFRTTEGKIFGTYYHITYQSRDHLEIGILKTMNDVDRSLSTFNKESTISLINLNRSKATDPMFCEVFSKAMEVARNTRGAFDITVAPLVNAWGFGFKNKENITDNLIDSIMHFVGYGKIRLLTDKKIEKDDPRLMLDCSGIAKGYGCDRVAQFLESKGVENYMVEIGGEICAHGQNSKAQPWTVGISSPKEDSLTTVVPLQSVLALTNQSLATSGNYRNFYYEGGKKYAHTIDPHSGHPVQHSLLSATVSARTCAEADAYATAFMVMGIDSAKSLLARSPQLKAYFICTDSTDEYVVWHSDGLNILQ